MAFFFQAQPVFVSCVGTVVMVDVCRTGSLKKANVQQDVVAIVCWKITPYFPSDVFNKYIKG